jgi:acetoin utilization deacetylase AcuC-like enzyme
MPHASSPIFDQHVIPRHPERIERAHVFEACGGAGRSVEGTPWSRGPQRVRLERIHDGRYLDEIAATAGRAMMLDPDTFTSPASHEVALLAAGAAIQAAELAVDRREPAFALVRPPGHHAERDCAMGFCLYNSVAAAAAAMLAGGLERVAIVDIDVHHGNGTQHIFYRDPRVLYVSTHQYPFWPGTGAAHETGSGEGQGFTVNVPMEAGSQDADYAVVYRAVIRPVLDAFRPQLTLVSAGYDAHERDPLASMRMTTRGYANCMRELSEVAARHGALACVTEGGYDLTSLAGCLEASFAAIDGRSSSGSELDEAPPDASRVAAMRGERAVSAALAALKRFWPDI